MQPRTRKAIHREPLYPPQRIVVNGVIKPKPADARHLFQRFIGADYSEPLSKYMPPPYIEEIEIGLLTNISKSAQLKTSEDFRTIIITFFDRYDKTTVNRHKEFLLKSANVDPRALFIQEQNQKYGSNYWYYDTRPIWKIATARTKHTFNKFWSKVKKILPPFQ